MPLVFGRGSEETPGKSGGAGNCWETEREARDEGAATRLKGGFHLERTAKNEEEEEEEVTMRSRWITWLVMTLVLAVVAVGCAGGGEPAGSPEGTGAETTGAAKGPVTVGSKEFTEQLILGQIALLALEGAGFEVVDKTGLQGTDAARSALEKGDIDLYWEYTGTAWLVALGHDEPVTDSEEAYQKVKEEDAANGLAWLSYAPFDNTYTLMMRQTDAEELGIQTLSDLAEYVKAHPQEVAFATDHEFYARPDGFPALEELYGFQFPRDKVLTMDPGLTYQALRDGQVQVAMGFATDGRIEAFDFVNLEDDQHFFPVYNPAPVVRQEVLDKWPEVAEILGQIGPKLDTETMINLNYQVDIEEKEPRDVAGEWLRSQGLIQ